MKKNKKKILTYFLQIFAVHFLSFSIFGSMKECGNIFRGDSLSSSHFFTHSLSRSLTHVLSNHTALHPIRANSIFHILNNPIPNHSTLFHQLLCHTFLYHTVPNVTSYSSQLTTYHPIPSHRVTPDQLKNFCSSRSLPAQFTVPYFEA